MTLLKQLIIEALNEDNLYHPDTDVRHEAIQHPKATPEHINKALNDPEGRVRELVQKRLKNK